TPASALPTLASAASAAVTAGAGPGLCAYEGHCLLQQPAFDQYAVVAGSGQRAGAGAACASAATLAPASPALDSSRYPAGTGRLLDSDAAAAGSWRFHPQGRPVCLAQSRPFAVQPAGASVLAGFCAARRRLAA